MVGNTQPAPDVTPLAPVCIITLSDRGLPALLHSSVRQVPVLLRPQCMLLRNLGPPFQTSVHLPLGQQDFSAHWRVVNPCPVACPTPPGPALHRHHACWTAWKHGQCIMPCAPVCIITLSPVPPHLVLLLCHHCRHDHLLPSSLQGKCKLDLQAFE
jgi:hypothetical protein